MFRFENGFYLYALAIIPILITFFVVAWKARKLALKRFGNLDLVQRLMPDASNNMHIVKFILLTLALALLVVGLGQSSMGHQERKGQTQKCGYICGLGYLPKYVG